MYPAMAVNMSQPLQYLQQRALSIQLGVLNKAKICMLHYLFAYPGNVLLGHA